VRLGREENSRERLEEAVDVLQEAAEIYRERRNVSGSADIANNLGQAQCMLRRFGDGIPNLEAALEYFDRSGQTDLAAQVREDLEDFRQHARARGGADHNVQQGPWSAEDLGGGRFRFKNMSGGKLAMIALSPIGATQVRVEDGIEDDPHTVPAPVDAGESFIALVRGQGMRVTATAVPSMTHVYWDFTT